MNSQDENNTGLPPLHNAALRGNVKEMKELLKQLEIQVNGKDVHGCNPLHWASQYGHVEIVKELLKHPDIDVNCKDKKKRTPLHLAVINVHPKVVKILVSDSRIDPNLKDKDCRTPFYFALCYDYDYEKESKDIIHKKVSMYEILLKNPVIAKTYKLHFV